MGKRKGSNATALSTAAVHLVVTPSRRWVLPGIGHFMARLICSTWLGLFASLLLTGVFVGQSRVAQANPEKIASDVKKAEKPARTVDWEKIPAAERTVLAPLQPEWAKLPGLQQRRLLGAAKEYPKLAPLEQERFRERLKGWSSLTPDQRKSARDKYQSLAKLPPEKQQALKDRWNQEKGPGVAPTPAAAEPPPATAPK